MYLFRMYCLQGKTRSWVRKTKPSFSIGTLTDTKHNPLTVHIDGLPVHKTPPKLLMKNQYHFLYRFLQTVRIVRSVSLLRLQTLSDSNLDSNVKTGSNEDQ